jgi:PPOX class probable F420-dependent enzyme
MKPLTPALERFLRQPNPAVIATVRPDGAPATTASWYDWIGERILLSMVKSSPRTRNVRGNPALSLTILDRDWYHHLSLRGRAVQIRDDLHLADLDRLSERYYGHPYPKRELRCVSVLMEIEHWYAWGEPGSRPTEPTPTVGNE